MTNFFETEHEDVDVSRLIKSSKYRFELAEDDGEGFKVGRMHF